MSKTFEIDRRAALFAAAGLAVGSAAPAAAKPPAPSADRIGDVAYKTVAVGDVDVFYREAGPAGAPVILALHGFPTASYMFRNLIPRLDDRYRIIAPDLPAATRRRRRARNSPIRSTISPRWWKASPTRSA